MLLDKIMTEIRKENWPADVRAGTTAALVALPVAIGGGILATASLGPEFTSAGVRAGLLCAIVAAIVTAIFGSSRYAIGGPSAATSIVLAGGLAQLVNRDTATAAQVGMLMALIVGISGVMLVLAGARRFGNFIKFIPRPVLAGFVNGIALLVAYSQLGAALGISGGLRWHADILDDFHWGAPIVCAVTVLVCLKAAVFKLPMPAQFGGLVAGFATHYLLQAVFPGAVGAVVGQLPTLFAAPEWVQVFGSTLEQGLSWGQILAAALLLSIMGAVQTLMTAVAVDSLAHARHDANRELVGFGIGNIASALCGGVASSANLGRAMANYRAGAVSRRAAAANGIVMLLVVVLAIPVIAAVPMAVMAGILIHSSLVMTDVWSLEQFRRWYHGQERGEVRENVIVITVMTLGMLWMSPVVAVAVGVILTMGLFLKRMSKAFIRRAYTCEAKRSLKVRIEGVEARLRDVAAKIHVIELEGAIFFGTADRLRHYVETHHREAAFIILDCRRVREWDATGVQLIGQLHRGLALRGVTLLLAHVLGRRRVEQSLRAYGLPEMMPAGHLFADLDRALEYAEDLSLVTSATPEEVARWHCAQLQNTVLLKDLDEGDQHVLARYFDTLELPEGETLFQSGDAGDRLYVLLEGEITLGFPIDGHRQLRRLFTITPGVVFGEMALLDAQPRSAHARADRSSVLKALSRSDFERLRLEQPGLFAKVLQNIAHEMSLRLRITNNQLRALDE